MIPNSADVAPWLWVIAGLLTARVLAQIVAVTVQPNWLPPQGEQWMSGLMPYHWLLPAQLLVLTTMYWVAVDYSSGRGVFVDPHPRAALAWLWFSYMYFCGMVLRYFVRMTRRPDQRWVGGTIPIIFHSLMAVFLWLAARPHTIYP